MKILESIAWIVLGFVIVFIFMELVRRLCMSDASKSKTNEASKHNNGKSLVNTITALVATIYKCNEGKNETCVATNLIP
jgi:hypothetical protein